MGVRVSQVKFKLLQITPYVNDYSTVIFLNNPGSRQPVGASKN